MVGCGNSRLMEVVHINQTFRVTMAKRDSFACSFNEISSINGHDDNTWENDLLISIGKILERLVEKRATQARDGDHIIY